MKKIMDVLIFVILFSVAGWADDKPVQTRIELACAATSGNTETETISGNLDIKGMWEKNRIIMRSGYIMVKDNQQDKADKFNAEIRYERILAKRLFGFAESTCLRDRFSGYQYRLSTGPGLGFQIIKKDHHDLKCLVSGRYDMEKALATGSEPESYVTAKFDCEYTGKVREYLTVKSKADYLTVVERMEKYFINAEAALETLLSGQIALGLKLLISYQNEVPSPEIKNTDTAFLASLIFNF